MTAPENFRRDAGWPCPVCKIGQHSPESLGIHYKTHSETEKRQAWEETLRKHRRVFMLVEVGEK